MNPITTTQLENTQRMTLPSSITAPVPDISSFTSTTPQMQEQQTQVNKAKKEQQGTLSNIFTGLSALGTRGATQMQLEENAGIGTMSKELVDIENQLRQTDLDFRREREAIQVTPGLTQAQMQARLGDVTRKQSSQRADLEVVRQARSNSLTNAQSLIDKKVELEFADKQANVDALKYIYNEKKESLSKEEDKLLSETIRREERAFGLAKDDYERLTTTQVEAVKNAQLSGASNGAMGAIMGKKSMAELLADPQTAKYLVSPKEKLELQKLNIDIASSNLEYQNTLQEMAKAKAYLNGTTGDPTLDIISASSQYGDKRLTDSQLEKIQKATSALGTMESLQATLGLNGTGPLKGRARTLVSQMGGDADAKAINATIQGLIPTVARGIFGEVGVLTDADIENYKKTVPNLNSTEAQNKLVSLVMYDVLSRSVKSTLISNAQNQANVSNFASTYMDVEKRINALKSELGVTEPAPISNESRVKMESAWGGQSFSTGSVTQQLNSLLEM